MENKKVAHICGHLDLTQEEFYEHYKSKIDEIINKDHNIIVGDAKGADLMSQQYLKELEYNYVIIFHMFDEPRNNVGPFAQLGGFESDKERDDEMISKSNYSVGWVRPGKEKSWTAKHLKRHV